MSVLIRSEVSIRGKFNYRQTGWKYSGGIRLLLFVFLVTVFYLALHGRLVPRTYDIMPNTVSEKTIHAPKQMENAIETQKAKESAAQKVQQIYRIVPVKNDKLIDSLFEKLRNNNADATLGFDTKVSLYRDVFPSIMKDFIRQSVISLSPGQYNKTFNSEVDQKMTEQIYKIPEEAYYKLPKLTKDDLDTMEPVTKEIVGKLMSDQITDAQTARTKVAEMVNTSTLAKNTQRELVQELVRFTITPNTFYDVAGTEEARAQVRENTPPVYINKNDILVNKGEMITDEIYQRLEKLDLLKDKVSHWPQIGLLLLASLFVLALYVYIEQGNSALKDNNGQMLMLVIIFAVNLLGIKIVALGEILNYPYIGYLAPVSIGSMLIALLLETRLALFTSILISVLAGIILNTQSDSMFDFRYGLVSLVMCITAVLSLHKAIQRTTILRSGIMVSLFALISILALFLLDNHYSLRNMLFAGVFAIAGGLLTVIFVIGLMPFFETFFGILSPLKLVELSNPNHPLLRKLLTETPGTYHHSIMVGNLAEAAAEAIGADGLLCRVGSYYHDIGKTKRPSYFIENQQNIENPHGSMDPSLSKSIIVAHPRDGLEMLKEYKIPKPIRDIAEQHHGTTLLQYFYHKAVQDLGEESGKEIPEENYRYPGPKAQSKEAAIVGIADCVEAAVRSLRNPTVEQIDSMVQKILKSRLDDGQFDECDLTIKELNTIAKALRETLLGIFHSRIEYPSDLPKQTEKSGDPA